MQYTPSTSKPCLFCGFNFTRRRDKNNNLISITNWNRALYCSRGCYARAKIGTKQSPESIEKRRRANTGRKTGCFVVCDWCGTKAYRYPRDIKKHTVGGKWFCGSSCKNEFFKGKHLSPKTEFGRGSVPWNKGLCVRLNPGGEFKVGLVPWNKGKRFPQISGERNNKWKGGVTPTRFIIRNIPEMFEWKLSIFKRDHFKCVWCGDSVGNNLNADHIKPFATILDENNIIDVDGALKCKELWDINNGQTLCKKCHLIKTKNDLRGFGRNWKSKSLKLSPEN